MLILLHDHIDQASIDLPGGGGGGGAAFVVA